MSPSTDTEGGFSIQKMHLEVLETPERLSKQTLQDGMNTNCVERSVLHLSSVKRCRSRRFSTHPVRMQIRARIKRCSIINNKEGSKFGASDKVEPSIFLSLHFLLNLCLSETHPHCRDAHIFYHFSKLPSTRRGGRGNTSPLRLTSPPPLPSWAKKVISKPSL